MVMKYTSYEILEERGQNKEDDNWCIHVAPNLRKENIPFSHTNKRITECAAKCWLKWVFTFEKRG